jgi:hypothetical protein
MRTSQMLAICAVAMLAGGCGDYTNKFLAEDLEFLYAVPAKSTLELRVAEIEARRVELATQSSGLGQRNDAVLGDPATWYLYTRLFSLEVNLHVLGFLDLVDTITSFAPTARDKDVRLWGPWPSLDTPQTDWRFLMNRNRAAGTYDFALQVNASANRDTPAYAEGWENCLFGAMNPSKGSFRRGMGNLTADVETCNKYENTGERGLASIGFDTAPDENNPEGKTHLSIQFADFVSKDMLEADPDPQPINAQYLYLEDGDFSGSFDFDVWTDLSEGDNPDALAPEHVVLKVRWDQTGAGRADSRWTDGDLGALVIELHECWDTGKERVFYEDSHGIAPTEGVEGSCVLPPATFD